MKTITGVISSNAVWLDDEIANGIDLDYIAHCAECSNEEHDMCWETWGNETVLIGDWKLGQDGKYSPDKRGPNKYAAIVSECETQVVYSKTIAKVRAMSSPCFPGQADLDSGRGKIRAYTLPIEIIGEED